jgi:hypothetical protein
MWFYERLLVLVPDGLKATCFQQTISLIFQSPFYIQILSVSITLQVLLFLLLIIIIQSALQPLVGFRPAQLPLSILSRKVLQSAVANGTSNPNLEENQGFRAFQLSPQEAPSF